MISLTEAASALQDFEKGDLGERIGAIEAILKGADASRLEAAFPHLGIGNRLLEAALTLKATAGQVNVLIHAIGILLAIPFDLETTLRVSEFKFIRWRGGSEAIRQNSLFKDFYLLAECETQKLKELYVIGTEHPLKFLHGGRALSSVMSRNNRLWAEFQRRYGSRFSTVSDYYTYRKSQVSIKDLTSVIPMLSQPSPSDEEEESL